MWQFVPVSAIVDTDAFLLRYFPYKEELRSFWRTWQNFCYIWTLLFLSIVHAGQAIFYNSVESVYMSKLIHIGLTGAEEK